MYVVPEEADELFNCIKLDRLGIEPMKFDNLPVTGTVGRFIIAPTPGLKSMLEPNSEFVVVDGTVRLPPMLEANGISDDCA
jgi:hypothetical protein